MMFTRKPDLSDWYRPVCLALALVVPALAVGGWLAALAAHAAPAPASAAGNSAPTTLAYQGQVQVNGQPFSGTGQFKFAIVSLNGSAVYWTNDGSGGQPPGNAVALHVAGGVFNVLLGDTSLAGMTQPLTVGAFLQPGRALRVWFNDGTNGFQQLAPDVTLAAVPYALNAETLDGLDSTAFAAAAHTHAAGDIVTGTLDDARLSGDVVLGGQAVSRLSNDAGYLTTSAADARYARNRPTTQQIALLKWYTVMSSTLDNFNVGWNPEALAFDGANIWVVDNGPNGVGNTVNVLRASDGYQVMTPTVGYGAMGIAFDGADMWVTNWHDGTVSVLRAGDGHHVMTPTVGAGPLGIAFDGVNMWVANSGSGNVSVLRASDGAHVMTPTAGIYPTDIAFDGANMWVVGYSSSTVSVLGVGDGHHVMTATVGSGPWGIAFDGANMWVANNNAGNGNTVSVLRTSDGAHVMTATVGAGPIGVAFDGENIWVANAGTGNGNTVSVLRASDGAHVMTPTVGTYPFAIAFDGANMWVTNAADNTVSKR